MREKMIRLMPLLMVLSCTSQGGNPPSMGGGVDLASGIDLAGSDDLSMIGLSDMGPIDAHSSDGGKPLIMDFCTGDRWCWDHPGPQGNTLRAVWGTSGADVWFAGDHGTLIHRSGAVLTDAKPSTKENLLCGTFQSKGKPPCRDGDANLTAPFISMSPRLSSSDTPCVVLIYTLISASS